MNFTDFTKYQCLKNLSSYEHTNIGKFYPSVGIIEINSDIETFHKEGKEKGYRPLQYAYLHELLHAYHLYGSSLGVLELSVHDLQNFLLSYYLDEYQKTSYSSFKDFLRSPEYNPFNILNKENPLLSLVELRTLFGSGYDHFVEKDSFYVPLIKDYLQQIHYFLHWYQVVKKIGLRGEKIAEYGNPLYMELIPRAKFPSDFLIHTSIFDKAKLFVDHPLNYCLLSGEEAWLIPTRAVVEGYAKLIESLTKKTDNDILELPNLDVDRIFQVDCTGIYGVTNSLLFNILGSYMKFGTPEHIHTCFAIYELSLMSRLYPDLLISQNKLSYRELFIPHRFGAVLFHLADKKKSIYDYCSSIEDIGKGLDAICDELNWMRYSDCLQKLFNDIDFFDEYLNAMVKNILSEKIKGQIYPFNRSFQDVLESLEIIIAFNETLSIPTAYKDDYQKGLALCVSRVVSLIKDLFLRHALFDYDFDKMVDFIKKYMKGFLDREAIKNILDKEGLSDLNDYI